MSETTNQFQASVGGLETSVPEVSGQFAQAGSGPLRYIQQQQQQQQGRPNADVIARQARLQRG